MSFPEVAIGQALEDADVFDDGDWVESKDQDPNGDVRLVQLADVGDGWYVDKSDRFMTSAKARKLNCTYLKPGDLLVARMPDPLGRCCIFPGDEKPCVTVVDVCIMRPNPKHVDARWLMHCVNSPVMRHRINAFTTGTTRKRISRGNLSKVKIPLPPLSEQKRIAAILDRAEALRAQRRAALALLDELTQSIFLDMFGDPRHEQRWPTESLQSLSVSVTKGESPKWQGFGYQDEGALFVTSENVRDGHLDISKPKYVPIPFHEKLHRSALQTNDLLVNLVGASIGRSCIFPAFRGLANVNQAVGVVRLDHDRISVEYVAAFLKTESGKEALTGRRVESARANVSLTNVRELLLPVPPPELQSEFRSRLQRMRGLAAIQQAAAQNLESLFASIQQRAFRGEL